jgi:sugar phosphate isomerase/epimerase
VTPARFFPRTANSRVWIISVRFRTLETTSNLEEPFMRLLKTFAAAALAMATLAAVGQEKSNPELIVDKTFKDQVVTAPKPKLNKEALSKLGWMLGTQAYTWRHVSLMETIDIAGDLDLQYVELYPGQAYSKDNPAKADHNSMTDAMIKEVTAKLKSRGLVAQSYGVVPVGANEAETRKVFEFCKKMGIKTVVSEPPRKIDADRSKVKPEDAPGLIAQDRKMFEMLDKLLEEYDLRLAIHNHPEPNPYGTPEKVLEVVEGRSNRIGSCADIGHWQRSGIKPVDAMKKLEGRIVEFHFKDLNEFGNKNAYDVPWGTGVGDIKAVMAEAKRQNIHAAFSIEFERQYPGMTPDIAQSINFFSQTATELAK